MQLYKFDDKIHLHLYLKDGKWEPLTGTSSVVGVLAKPLTWWASGLAVAEFGWLNPKKAPLNQCKTAAKKALAKIKKMTIPQFMELLDKAYRAHSIKLKDTAEAGTDLHAELEKFVKWKMGIIKGEQTFDEKIKPFIDWTNANVKKFIWSEAHCYDLDLWVGGISDAGAELNDGSLALIDFKSSKEAYDSHFLQAGGYALQIDKNGLWDFEGKRNLKLTKPIDHIIIVPFGAEEIVPQFNKPSQSVAILKQGFEWCVGLYRLLGMDKN